MGETLWILGAFWIIYGIAGLRGHQNIKNEFKNRPWTLEYKKACGRCWLPGLGNHLPCDGSQWIKTSNLLSLINC